MVLFPVDPCWGRWPRLCQALCGRDARAPRRLSSHEIVTPRAYNFRGILVPLTADIVNCARVRILRPVIVGIKSIVRLERRG